jgi:hypothetical protein
MGHYELYLIPYDELSLSLPYRCYARITCNISQMAELQGQTMALDLNNDGATKVFAGSCVIEHCNFTTCMDYINP